METEPKEVNDFSIEPKLENSSSEQTQGDIYHQDGSFAIGHMDGGTIGKGAQVAGAIYKLMFG